MFSSLVGGGLGTATIKMLASGNATPELILSRVDLVDVIKEYCNPVPNAPGGGSSANQQASANLKHLLHFTERHLPRILQALQKPATVAATSMNNDKNVNPKDAEIAFEVAQGAALLAARNASALIVKFCQCCAKPMDDLLQLQNQMSINNKNHGGIGGKGAANGTGAGGPPYKFGPPVNPNAINTNTSNTLINGAFYVLGQGSTPHPLGKVVPVVLSLLGRRSPLPDSVAVDVQRILLSALEANHRATLYYINTTLRPGSELVGAVVQHLSTSIVVAETLVSLFGSALHAKAMMVEVEEPAQFVNKWIECGLPSMLARQLLRCVDPLNRTGVTPATTPTSATPPALLPPPRKSGSNSNNNVPSFEGVLASSSPFPFFYFLGEILKRAFSPNVGPLVDALLSVDVFKPMLEGVLAAAEASLGKSTKVPPAGEVLLDTPLYLSEGMHVVYQCVSIVRRSLPPTESEHQYLHSRKLLMSHGVLQAVFQNLPRLVKMLVQGRDEDGGYLVPPGHTLSYVYVDAAERLRKLRRARASQKKNIDDADEVITTTEEKKEKESSQQQNTSVQPATTPPLHYRPPPLTQTRLHIIEIFVELTLFRSQVCDEAVLKEIDIHEGCVDKPPYKVCALSAMLCLAERYPQHDLLLRHVHRVLHVILQRPAYQEHMLASNAKQVTSGHSITGSSPGSKTNNKSIAGVTHVLQEVNGHKEMDEADAHIYTSTETEFLAALTPCKPHYNTPLDASTAALLQQDKLVHYLLRCIPVLQLLYSWAIGPEVDLDEVETESLPKRITLRNFTGTSLQAHALSLLQRLADSASTSCELVKAEVKNIIQFDSTVGPKVMGIVCGRRGSLDPTDNTGGSFGANDGVNPNHWGTDTSDNNIYYNEGSGCQEKIVHRPTQRFDLVGSSPTLGPRGILGRISSAMGGNTKESAKPVEDDVTNEAPFTSNSPNKSGGSGDAPSPNSREFRYAAAYDFDDDGDTSGPAPTNSAIPTAFHDLQVEPEKGGLPGGMTVHNIADTSAGGAGWAQEGIPVDKAFDASGLFTDGASEVNTRPRSRNRYVDPSVEAEISQDTAGRPPVMMFNDDDFKTITPTLAEGATAQEEEGIVSEAPRQSSATATEASSTSTKAGKTSSGFTVSYAGKKSGSQGQTHHSLEEEVDEEEYRRLQREAENVDDIKRRSVSMDSDVSLDDDFLINRDNSREVDISDDGAGVAAASIPAGGQTKEVAESPSRQHWAQQALQDVTEALTPQSKKVKGSMLPPEESSSDSDED